MAAEVHHYKIGDIDVTVLSDGFRMVPVDGNYLSNASTYDLARALAAAGLPADKMKNTYSPIVLTTGGKRVLFDTGNGEAAAAQSNGERGTLNANLAAAGIDRDAHRHRGDLAFPRRPRERPADGRQQQGVSERRDQRAGGRMEFLDGRRRDEPRAEGPHDRAVSPTIAACSTRSARQVTPYAWDKEVVPGVTAVGTPGHSIGHTSYVVSSGGKTVYVQSDVCNNFAVFAPHPDWQGFFDQDPPRPRRRAAGSTTCWWRRGCRCRPITFRSRRWRGSRSRATAIVSC